MKKNKLSSRFYKQTLMVMLSILIILSLTACKKKEKIPKSENNKTTQTSPVEVGNETENQEDIPDYNPPAERKLINVSTEELKDAQHMELGKFVEATDIDYNILDEIYNIDQYKSDNFQYEANVRNYTSDNRALNLSSTDLDRLLAHYETEYIAKKYGINYTLQDLVEFTKETVEVHEIENIEDIYASNWLTIQTIGWEQYALSYENYFVMEKVKDLLQTQGRADMTEENIQEALSIYRSGLEEQGLTEEEIKNTAIELYIETFADYGQLEVEANLYAKMKLLKEILPEKYNQIIAQNANLEIGQAYENVDLTDWD